MTHRHPLTPGRAGAASAVLALVLASAAAGGPVQAAGGEGGDVPQGAVVYRATAQFATAGRVRDLLLHPDSEKLYVGSDDLPETTGSDESGLHVLEPADGTVRSTISQAPGPTGTVGRRAVRQLVAPLPGDGAVFVYPLRGIGTAKDGDAAAAGAWVPGGPVTDAAAGPGPSTVLVAQGSVLSEIDLATAAVRRSVTLEGGNRFAYDRARGTVWFTDLGNRRMYRVDLAAFQVVATVELPAGDGFGGFTEVDPETGAVWVGLDTSVVVHDAAGKRTGVIEGGGGADTPRAAGFDAVTHEAFVVWQDPGDTSQPGSDDNGALTVHRTRGLQEAAKPVVLPGNHAQLGSAAVAVQPGGAAVFVSDPAAGRITRLERSTSPRITRSPESRTVAAGAEVSLTARAEGTPAPTVVWQVSTDAGRTWRAVPGASSTTYSFKAAPTDDGHRYRAEFTNDAGVGRTDPAVLTVTAPGTTTGGGGTAGTSHGSGGSGGSDAPGGPAAPAGPGGSAATVGGDGVAGGSTGGAAVGPIGGSAGSSAAGASGTTVGGTGTTPAGGALATTGTAVASLTGAALVLTAAGWVLVRRTRPSRAG
ncbi:immunoglobulin domain-containing protein [Streptomyces sp. gCLA4]|uniref:immunoglobulin domain-containing protein n=1 Tax=Streptomyces sp. gCLA4 TaxID=1873416 RepID=UPI0015FEE256|nr:immunoglobulin domain-containing protein [Streptomyces sp. gCLA4]